MGFIRIISPLIAASTLLTCLSQSALAQDLSTHQQQAKLIKAPEANLPSGIELFGDTVNLYTGGLNLAHVDVSLPGNSKLPVAIGRRLSLGSTIPSGRQFGRWELDVPYIHTTVSTVDGWVTRDGDQLRCSKFGAPRRASTGASYWNAVEFWPGNLLYVPGVGEQRMLARAAGNTRAPGGNVGAHPVVTSERWAFSCTNVANGGGEGFVAVSPDGTSYRFDWLVTYQAPGLSKHVSAPMGYLPETSTEPITTSNGPPSEMIGSPNFFLPRTQVALMPTIVTDRFGNTVRYTYDPAKPNNLTKIEGSDGRVLSITYGYGDQSHLIHTVSDGSRTWNYSYYTSHSGLDLDRVTLPDQSAWQLGGLKDMFLDVQVTEYTTCSVPTSVQPHVLEGELTHPSGASARFKMEPVLHGRNQVPKARCGDYVYILQTPKIFYTHSLLSKTVSGPALPTMHWQYDYGPARNSYTGCTTCLATKSVTVTDPENLVTLHTFGSHFGVNEGKLLQTDHGWDGSSALRSVALGYRAFNAGPYLPEEGVTERYMGDAGTVLKTSPVETKVTTQQGVALTWAAELFDDWARPLTVKRSSTLGTSRTEATSYEDNISLWVLGQVKEVAETTTGKKIVSNTYFPGSALLQSVSRFGRLDQQMTYHADGNLATRADGKQQTTRFENYKRGVAQNITYADSTTQSAVVNNIGKLDSITDANGYVTGYAYNANGLLAQVIPPANDTVAWNPTTITFNQINGWEYDFGPGHWRKISTTGAGQTITYYDGLWRPVLTHTSDLNDPAATSSMVKKRFDSAGNNTFTSFAKRNFAELGDGVTQVFDALDRKTNTYTNSELGVISTSFSYDTGFATTETNGRGNVTTTRYRVYDEPVTNLVTSVSAPEGIELWIERDLFDKPKVITRSGHGKSATRAYVYDAHERLCKTIEPESGSTVQAYDTANNIAWKAGGLALPAVNSCDAASVAAADKMVLGYNAVNQLTSTNFGDGSPGVTRTYTPDGLVETVESGGTLWRYGYNKRRLNDTETLSYGGATYTAARTFDSNGSVATLTYPDQSSVSFAPNALGQERQVGTYATGIQYHPNGAVAGFRYGNGLQRTLSQNVRGLPERSTDSGVLNDSYTYDQNANVTSISDSQEGISTRMMEYDAQDRLKRTYAPAMWGDALYTYDALDNITTTSLSAGSTARQTTFQYASPSTNRLDSITGTAGFNLNYDYDKHGNITTRGTQRYVFDLANRMKEAVGKATYAYDGWNRRVSSVDAGGNNKLHMYSKAGQLLFSGPTNGAKTRYIYLNNHLLAEDGAAGVQYSHSDALGSPVARTNAAGALVSRTRYEPFGLTAMGATPNIGFTGHVNDADTGLVYMQQRYYDPIAGRMMSIDPVSTDADTGSVFNRYNYANNSPYKFVDPDGRLPILIPVLIFVAKEVAGEAFERATGIPAPTVKNATKAVAKIAVKAASKTSTKAAKTYQTYNKKNEKTGEVYNGRTSGTGTPAENIAKRDGPDHHINQKGGFGPATLDKSSSNPDAIRGREQLNIEASGGSKRSGGSSGNEINGISDTNPKRAQYIKAAQEEFK